MSSPKRDPVDNSPAGIVIPERGEITPLTQEQQKRMTSRRRFLQWTAGGSLAAIGTAFGFSILAVQSLTQYQDVVAQGDIVAGPDGRTPIDVASFPVNSGSHAYPLGKPTSTQQNQVELVRVAETGTAEDFRAYSQICTHLSCPVNGELVEGTIHCFCHGSQFDPETGDVVNGPANKPLPSIALAMNEEGQLIFDSAEYSATIGPGA